MVGRLGVFADVPRQAGVIDRAGPRRHRAADVAAQRIGGAQPFRNAKAGDQRVQVGGDGEVTGVDDGRLRRVGGRKADGTPALRFKEHDGQAQSVGRWRG